jgi:hypothetical protein
MIFLWLMVLALVREHPASPIHVDSCSFVRAGSFEHSVEVRFRNTSDRIATVVAFEVHNGPHRITIRDRGSFAPNVEIDHRLSTPTWELYHAQPHSCVVTYVRFEDGTSWPHAQH